MSEQWKKIQGCDDRYEVSNKGRFRSLRGMGCFVILKQTVDKGGYLRIALGKVKKTSHRVVLEAFVGIRPDGMVARHLDGDKKNNELCNLTWGTQKDNCADKVLHGTVAVGESNGRSVLSNDQARTIKYALIEGESRSSLATEFGVKYDVIRGIDVGRNRKWLT